MLFPAQKHDIGALRVDVQIAVPGADGTVAVGDLLRREREGEHLVFNGAAVAIGCVPDLDGGEGEDGMVRELAKIEKDSGTLLLRRIGLMYIYRVSSCM